MSVFNRAVELEARRAFLVLAACSSLAACDGGASLSFTPPFILCPLGDEVDFGSVPAGSTRRQHFVLQNSGSVTLEVSSITVDTSAGEADAFRVSSSAVAVPPADTAAVELFFNPRTSAPSEAQLVIENNSNNEPRKIITLRGFGAPSETVYIDGGVQYIDGGVVTIDGGVVTIDGGVVTIDGGVQFIDGGLQFIDGGLQFIDGGLQFIDGGLQFIDGGLPSIDGGMETTDAEVSPADAGGSGGDAAAASCDAGASGTVVSGVLANQTWTAAGSPYLVGGDVVAASLTIEPGTNVSFCGDYELQIAGPLDAVGTDSEPIVFSGESWRGLYFNGTPAGAILSGCVVSGGNQGGIRINGSSPTITNCRIENNTALEEGAGILISGATSAPTITNSTITGNDCEDFLAGGGGLFIGAGASATIRNCLIVGNESEGDGAGIYADGPGTVLIENTVIADNEVEFFASSNMAGGIYTTGTSVTVRSSIIFDNEGLQVNWFGTAPTISHSAVQNGFPGTGNTSSNPIFADAEYHLLSGSSPCIDTGDPDPSYNDVCFPPSLGGARNDMGAFGGPGACLGTSP